MRIPITPGTLCWLTASPYPTNNGKVAEVVAAAWPTAWLCTSKESILGACNGITREAAPGQQFLAHDFNLIPIAGPGLADEVTAFDKLNPPNRREEKAALYAALYGASRARSTPNVRR